MITKAPNGGVHRAHVTCDFCGTLEVVACDRLRRKGGETQLNIGQINNKLTSRKWVISNGKHECPACAARRRAFACQKKEEEAAPVMSVSATSPSQCPPREPTGPQKRLIVLALENSYDVKGKRYRGHETDATLAADLGDGIMPGWVAALREDMFGPSGGNEEIEAIRSELATVRGEFQAQSAALSQRHIAQVEALSKRLDAVCAAVGPRAERL
ncbi:hypothetical protein [Paracoccus sulfuroxidans]|uniref:Uncharacterized protein n=1 Tax=Paracoccus sulfuroxidans TaxID=384678 RepID=A0A562NCT5_9RHOB|nr:hypothetical protein [Paracoccus sulfuroxidans]TWI29721.1 hypothetical protein IQ24_03538 [Paracoccus sulfuroxidans]